MDDTVMVYPSASTKYDFQIQAFKFTGGFDEVQHICITIVFVFSRNISL